MMVERRWNGTYGGRGVNGDGWKNILGKEESDRRTAGRFYVAVVQLVLLFGSKTWVLTPRLEKAL